MKLFNWKRKDKIVSKVYINTEILIDERSKEDREGTSNVIWFTSVENEGSLNRVDTVFYADTPTTNKNLSRIFMVRHNYKVIR